MMIHHIVLGISSLAWFMTIFKQKKSSVFFYFLIMGIADPLTIIGIYSLRIPTGIIYTIASILILIALRSENLKSLKFKILDYIILLALIVSVIASIDLFYFGLVIHSFILTHFIQRTIITLHFKGELNVFFLILVFYELSLILKGIVFASGTMSGFLFFFLTLAFQILIAIFFIIFREDNPKLIFKLNPIV